MTGRHLGDFKESHVVRKWLKSDYLTGSFIEHYIFEDWCVFALGKKKDSSAIHFGAHD